MNIIRFLVISGIFYSTPLFADPVVRINLTLKATIFEQTCVVSPGSEDITVALGTWMTRGMSNVAMRTQSIPFSIQLAGCTSDTVAISFIGESDPTNVKYLRLSASSTAKNVAIEILDKDKKTLPLGTYSSIQNDTGSENIKLDFFANYISTGEKVIAGKANATANFLLEYD